MTLADWIGIGCAAVIVTSLTVLEVRHYRRNKRWIGEPYDQEREESWTKAS